MLIASNFFNTTIKDLPADTSLYLLDAGGNLITFGGGDVGGNMLSASQNFSGAPPTTRVIYGKATVTGAITASAGNNSIVGVRGEVNVGNYAVAAGFFYGAQGKLITAGQLNNGSAFNCGVLAQLDVSSATFTHTSGYLAPLICDVGASAALATDANLSGIYISNNTGCKMDAMIRADFHASFLLDMQDSQNDYSWFVSTAGASAGKYLVISVAGTTYKIALLAVS